MNFGFNSMNWTKWLNSNVKNNYYQNFHSFYSIISIYVKFILTIRTVIAGTLDAITFNTIYVSVISCGGASVQLSSYSTHECIHTFFCQCFEKSTHIFGTWINIYISSIIFSSLRQIINKFGIFGAVTVL